MSSSPGGILALIFTVIWTVLFNFGGFYLGRAILWMVSLGRYPTKHPTRAQNSTAFLIGVIALVAALVALRNTIWP